MNDDDDYDYDDYDYDNNERDSRMKRIAPFSSSFRAGHG